MGERYDVLVTPGDGVFPLVALAEGKNATGLALLRTGCGTAPAARPARGTRRQAHDGGPAEGRRRRCAWTRREPDRTTGSS